MALISVIIPVYKVENYLKECLDSVSSQSFKDFELILVDDGSPDSCGQMCEDYARTHPNTVVLHQKNAGLSAARNNGVKAAKGQYVSFIDSDDYVSSDYLSFLYDLISKYDADVAIGGVLKTYDSKKVVIPKKNDFDKCVLPCEALINICYGKYCINAWAKLYKKELVEKYPYPEGKLYEDIATTHKIIGDSDRVAYGTRVIYFYRQREQSITHDIITEKQFDGIEAVNKQLIYAKKNYPEAVPAAHARCAMKCIDIATRIMNGDGNRNLFNRVRNEMKIHLHPILKDGNLSLQTKIRGVAIFLGYGPCKLMTKMYTFFKR